MHPLTNIFKFYLYLGQHLHLSSLGVALVAFSCAFLVQTMQLEIDFTYPVEALLKTIMTNDIDYEPLYKIKL